MRTQTSIKVQIRYDDTCPIRSEDIQAKRAVKDGFYGIDAPEPKYRKIL